MSALPSPASIIADHLKTYPSGPFSSCAGGSLMIGVTALGHWERIHKGLIDAANELARADVLAGRRTRTEAAQSLKGFDHDAKDYVRRVQAAWEARFDQLHTKDAA